MVKKETSLNVCCCGGGSSFWGWFFLVIGAFFFSQAMGWISSGFPFWQLLLVIFGVYLISKNYSKK